MVECQIESQEQRERLYELLHGDQRELYDIDLWSEGIPAVGLPFTVLLKEGPVVELVLDSFQCHRPKSLRQYRFEREVRRPSFGLKTAAADIGNGFFNDYRGYQEILQEMKRLQADFPAVISKFGSLGKSVEGRSIPVIHLKSAKAVGKRQLIWISGGQHAREWVAVSSVMYVLEKLCLGYGQDPIITAVLDKFELAIAPVINPDGYEWTRSGDRLWRKNRSKGTGGSVVGVDLNRNWDVHWAEVGASRLPVSQIYAGPSAASEPEVRQTAAYIKGLQTRAAGIDVHSFGQLVLRNYGWTVQATREEARLKRIGDAIADAMNQPFASDYKSQRSSALYPSGGSMDDWMFDKARMPGFTIELRDHGEFGFLLPPEYIVPTGEELLAGVLALAQNI